LPVLVIDPWRRKVPEELSEGVRPRKAARLRPLKRCQSLYLDGEGEGGERRDAAQAGEAVDDLCPGFRGRLHRDGGVERVAAIAHGEHRRQGLFIGDLQGPLGEALPAEPELVRLRPGALLPDDAATQEQLGEPVAGAHQVGSGVLAGAYQVAGRLLGEAGHAYRDQFLEAQQASQPDGVDAVGLVWNGLSSCGSLGPRAPSCPAMAGHWR